MTVRVRTRRDTAVAGALCVGLAAVLTACGGEDEGPKGSNGVDGLSAPKIEKKTRAAVERARSVRLSGTVVSKGQTYRLEMRLKQNGGVGEVSSKGGDTFELMRVDKDLYLKADSEFWAHKEQGDDAKPSEADVAAAGKLEGKYVKVPHEDPAYEQLSVFTDMRVMLDGLLTLDGERDTGDHGEVDGTATLQLRAGEGKGGMFEVALDGTPYPLRLERGGSAGTVRLDDWNKSFALSAPKEEQVVDYGEAVSPEGSSDGSSGR